MEKTEVTKMRILFNENARSRSIIFDACHEKLENYTRFLKIVGAYQLERKNNPQRFQSDYDLLQYENEHLVKIIDGLDEDNGLLERLLVAETPEDVLDLLKPFERKKE